MTMQYIQSEVCVENLSLSVLFSSEIYTKATGNEIFTLHAHTSVEVFVCHSESFEIATENGNISVEEGDIAIVPSRFMHCQLHPSDKGTMWSSLLFSYTRNNVPGTSDLYGIFRKTLDFGEIKVIKNNTVLYDILSRMKGLENHPVYSTPALNTVYFITVLSELMGSAEQLRDSKSSHLTASLSDGKNEKMFCHDIMLIEKLNALINNGITSSSQAAQELFISTRQLSRIVRRLYGCTYHELVDKVRLEKAAKMLCQTDAPISTVGEASGFGSTFVRVFKKHYGITPKAYREIMGRKV